MCEVQVVVGGEVPQATTVDFTGSVGERLNRSPVAALVTGLQLAVLRRQPVFQSRGCRRASCQSDPVVAESFGTDISDQVVVFDPNTTNSVDVGSRFDGDDVSGKEKIIAFRPQHGRFGV